MMAGNASISAFPDGDDMMKWAAKIIGPEGTVYAKQEYQLQFEFPAEYPFKSPKVTFKTPCFHPNVDQYGNICLDILKVGVYYWCLSCACMPNTFSSATNKSVALTLCGPTRQRTHFNALSPSGSSILSTDQTCASSVNYSFA